MERSSSRWRFMNPFEWARNLYETFGAKHPIASLIVVMLIGAGLAATFWQIGAYQYHKGQLATAPLSVPASGAAATSGAKSPAVTGNGNTIQYGNPPPPEKKKPKE